MIIALLLLMAAIGARRGQPYYEDRVTRGGGCSFPVLRGAGLIEVLSRTRCHRQACWIQYASLILEWDGTHYEVDFSAPVLAGSFP